MSTDMPTGVTATADSDTAVTVSWTAPTDVGGNTIAKYRVMWKMSSATDYADADMAMTADAMAMSHQVTGLTRGMDYTFKVVALDADDMAISAYSAAAMETTHDVPGMPTGVTVVSSADGTTATVSWTAPATDGGSAITGYKVMYKMTGSTGDYMSMDAAADATSADISGLAPNTDYDIGVVAVNAVGDSAMAMGMGMTDDIAPNAPTASATADSRTQITVSWMAPADNGGSAVTGYIVEQSYMGSFLDDGIAHPDHVFTNHMEWWETLNCAGMLLAVGSDADPDMDSDDKAMYCGHFLNTAPSNITDATKELSDAAKTDVEMYFNKRYVITDATQMSASFMGLRPGAEYMYRVKAVNAAGAGMWSATDSATTVANMAPMAGDAIAHQTVTEGEEVMVQSTITDADDATLEWVADSSDDMTATATVDSMGMVTITGVAAGPATITVTAKDGFYAEGTQDITVTVESANVAPTAVGSIDAVTMTAGTMSEAMDVSMYFSDADEGDTLTYAAASDMEMYATAMIDGSMLTITGVAAGMATITVTATDTAGESATQTIMVAVEAIPLIAPTVKGTNPVGSGIILVSWDAVTNATGYTLIAVNLSDRTAPTRTASADAAAESGQIQNLTVGDEYLIFVGAFNDDLEYELSDYVRITAE